MVRLVLGAFLATAWLMGLADADLRSSLADSNIKSPDGLGPVSESYLRSYPRYDGAPSEVPRECIDMTYSDLKTSETEDTCKKYGIGVASTFVVPLLFCIIMGFAWLFFCCCRCCCNCCGERRPSHRYSSKEVTRAKLGMLFVVVSMFCLFMVGYSASSGVTQAIDTFETAGADAVDFARGVTKQANKSIVIAEQLLDIVVRANTTIRSVFPSKTQISSFETCVNGTFVILDIKDELVATLRTLERIVSNVVDFSALNTSVNSLDASVANLPNLIAVKADLVAINTSLSNLPNADQLSSDLSAINSSLQLSSTLTTVANKLSTLEATILAFNSPLANVRATVTQNEYAVSLLPDLDKLAFNISNPGSTSAAGLQSGLRKLNDSVNAYPDANTFRTEIATIESGIVNLTVALDITTEITHINTTVNNIPPLSRVSNNIDSIDSFRTTGFDSVSRMSGNVGRIQVSIDLLPSTSTLIDLVTQVNTSIANIKSVNFTHVKTHLVRLNRTLGELGCLPAIFEIVRLVNRTLVELPPSAKQVTDIEQSVNKALQNVTRYQKDITNGVKDLDSTTDAINDLPNFDNLIVDIRKLNDSLGTLPNLTTVILDIASMNSSLKAVPNLAPYKAQVSSLNSTLNIPNLNSMVTTINDINRTLNDLPNFNSFTSNLDKLNESASTLGPLITPAHDFVGSAGYNDVTGLPANMRSPLLTAISSLNDTVRTRPNATDLISKLDAINATIATRPNIANIIQNIQNLNSTLQTFPDINSLSSSVDSLKTIRSNTASLDNLIEGNTLESVNSSVKSLPDLSNTKRQITDMDKQIKDLSLNKTIDQLDLPTTTTRSEALKPFQDLRDMSDELTNLDTAMDDIRDGIDNATTEFNKVFDSLSDADEDRAKAKKDVDEVDGMRILVTNVILFIPFMGSLLGFCGCLTNRGCPAMYMALMFFPLAMIYFFISALLTPLSVGLLEVCPRIDEFIDYRLTLENITVDMESVVYPEGRDPGDVQLLDVNQTLFFAQDLFKYSFIDCKSPFADLIDAVSTNTLRTYANAKDYNVTIQINKLANGSIGGEPLRLRQPLLDLADAAEALLAPADHLIYDVVQSVKCGPTTKVWTGVKTALCDNFTKSLSITTAVLFFFALCMIPGICFGVRGYKRFQKKYLLGHVSKDKVVPMPEVEEVEPQLVDVRQARNSESSARDAWAPNTAAPPPGGYNDQYNVNVAPSYDPAPMPMQQLAPPIYDDEKQYTSSMSQPQHGAPITRPDLD